MNIPDLINSHESHRTESYIRKNYPDFYEFILNKYPHIEKFGEKLYLYINQCEPHKCPVCGKPTKFISFVRGYHEFCCAKCASLGTRDKMKQTCRKLYGGCGNASNILRERFEETSKKKYGKKHYNNPDKTKQTKLERYDDAAYANLEKCKQTKSERYGDPYYTNRDKNNKTVLERYGVDNISRLSQVKEKRKNTNLERYDKEYYVQSDDFKEKSEQTCLEKYGTVSYIQSEDYKNMNKEKYGVDYYFQSDDFREKTEQTCLEKYGAVSYFQSDEGKEKLKHACLEKYGVDYYFQSDDFREKTEQTCLEKYGSMGCPLSEETKQKIKNTCLERYGVDNYAKTNEYISKVENTCMIKYKARRYTQTQEFRDYIKERHDEIQEKAYNTKKSNNSFNKSTIEEKFKQYLEDNHINFIYQYRSDLYPFNCDFYFPDKDMYLEINGNWTHGKHPFDPVKDKSTLEYWIEQAKTSGYYKNAIETWTIRDPKKVQIAKDNNINLKVFYGNNLHKLINFYTTLTSSDEISVI